MKTLHRDKRDAFLRKLLKACKNDNVYSVIETAEQMGVNYDQVREWARESEAASKILKNCRRMCYEHCLDKNDPDGITKKISTTEVFKYMEENSDEFKETREKQESEYRRDRLRDEAERKGNEFPPDKIERVTVSGVKDNAPKQNTYGSKNKIAFDKIALPQQGTENIEAERINEWAERQKRTTPSFYLKQTTTEDETGKKNSIIGWVPAEQKPQTSEQFASSMFAATGSANEQYALKLVSQVASGCFNALGKDIKIHTTDIVNESTSVMLSLAPKDEIEGMLCSRLLVLHDQCMQYMARAATPEQTNAGIDLNINRATKLMRLYNETLDALNKHRRKGEQKVTVQHVNVSNGGQAVINGQLNQGEGVNAKS